jgi:hypothetical protein
MKNALIKYLSQRCDDGMPCGYRIHSQAALGIPGVFWQNAIQPHPKGRVPKQRKRPIALRDHR